MPARKTDTEHDPSAAHELAVSLKHLHQDADGTSTPAVFCPDREQYVSLRDCRDCSDCGGLAYEGDDAPMLRCGFPLPLETSRIEAGDGVGPEATVAAIMSTPVRAVSADTPISEVAAVFVGGGISAAPVVDDGGRAIGIVSKTDIVRFFYESDGNAERLDEATATDARLGAREGYHLDVNAGSRVRDVMTPMVLGIPDNAAVSRAAALMAYEQVHHLVVTNESLDAIGMVSSLDVMAWIARQEGYVVPKTRPSGAA